MFLIVLVAYAQMGYVLFGSEIFDFRTFTDAVFTLVRTILGDFNYLELEKADQILGPIFFITYIFLVFLVLLNMFLAIINDTYSEMKKEITENKLHMGSYVKMIMMRFFRKICFCKSGKNCFWYTKDGQSEEKPNSNIDDLKEEGQGPSRDTIPLLSGTHLKRDDQSLEE